MSVDVHQGSFELTLQHFHKNTVEIILHYNRSSSLSPPLPSSLSLTIQTCVYRVYHSSRPHLIGRIHPMRIGVSMSGWSPLYNWSGPVPPSLRA